MGLAVSFAQLVRRPDWPARLACFLEARRDMPFVWGANDCCSFAIAWVREMAGREVFAVDWSDARGARETLAALGGIRQAWRDVLGPEQQNWRMARRGDVVISRDDAGRENGMVCTGTTIAGPGERGLVQLPLDRALLVWRIG